MTRADMTRALDEEILRLQQVRYLLAGTSTLSTTLAGLAHTKPARPGHTLSPRSTISPEGRRRIAEAQKRRWAREKGL